MNIRAHSPLFIIALLGILLSFAHSVFAQTADEVTALINRFVELDSIELAKDVKFREGLTPSLHALDADESKMTVLKDPYEVFGKDEPGAAGWYRISFTVPEKLGKFAVPKGGYNLGVESNCLGAWEIYTYINGKLTGTSMAAGVPRVIVHGTVLSTSNQPATAWMSNAPLPCKPGDKLTVAILNTATPLGRGSPEGFGLRFLRLRFALAHTGARQPFFGAVKDSGGYHAGRGLHGAREMLATLKGEELAFFQEKLKQPLANLDAVFAAAETGVLDNLTKAMAAAQKEIDAAIKEGTPKRK